ncbi:MAG: hypothetical protein JO349_07040 [Candidatus Eremiobacteraeota bacterium]|nr:hypothetical protein [Candidatus Eremiobacteraeota bacterium]
MFIRTAIAALVAATVIESGAAFAQTAPQQVPPAVTAPAQGHKHRDRMAIFRGLNLSQDQVAKIQAIHKKFREKNANVTDRTQRRASMQAQRAEIMSVLTPDQQQKFQQRLAAMRNRWKQQHQTQTQTQ